MPPGFPSQVSKNTGDRDGSKGVDKMLAQSCKQTASGKREKAGVGCPVDASWERIRGRRWQEVLS